MVLASPERYYSRTQASSCQLRLVTRPYRVRSAYALGRLGRGGPAGITRPALPRSTLASLELVPADRRVALLIRHSHCPGTPTGEVGNDLGLSPTGVRTVEGLGTHLSLMSPGRLLSSRVPRAVETARAIARGAGWDSPVREDWRLGGPGAFVADLSTVGPVFVELGSEEVVRRQISGRYALPGIRSTG